MNNNDSVFLQRQIRIQNEIITTQNAVIKSLSNESRYFKDLNKSFFLKLTYRIFRTIHCNPRRKIINFISTIKHPSRPFKTKQLNPLMPWEKDLCNFPEKGSCTIDTNKLVLFVHFDNTNKISDTDILYLQKLKKISAKLVFITNSKLNDADIELAGRLSDLVIERPNQGYDFGAWKDALAIIGSSGITEFTQVVLVNNSCFAPATDLTMMFMEMEKEKADFWGNSIYPAVQEIIDLQNNKRKINTPEHIQSYFLVFNPRIIKSVDFNEFWLHIPYINSLNDVIKECEINLTPYFSSRGYTYSCYIKETITQQLHNGVDCSYKDPCQLIEWGSPFLKKKSLKFISDSHKNILSSYFLQKNNINILQKE